MSRRLGRSDLVLLLVPLLVGIALVWSMLTPRSAPLDERAQQLESEIRCPVCQGLSIADSPAVLAQQMRAVVHDQLAAGASDDSVRTYFTQRYGRWILLTPSSCGPDLALWLAPAVIVVIGATLVAARARIRRRVPAPAIEPMERRWSPLGSAVLAVTMVAAVAAPLAVAIGPRGLGQQITGDAPGIQAAPSITELEARAVADPSDPSTLAALGDAYLAANRGDEAIGAYERALRIDPGYEPALMQVGVILLSAGRPADAGPVFDRVLRTNPDQPDALLYRALARFQLDGQLTEQSRTDSQHFLAVAPADPRRAMVEELLASGASSAAP